MQQSAGNCYKYLRPDLRPLPIMLLIRGRATLLHLAPRYSRYLLACRMLAPPSSTFSRLLTSTSTPTPCRSHQHYLRFLRDPHDDDSTKSWNERLAEKYYANLYREFAVCDLKHFKSGNVSPSNRVPSPFSPSSLPSAGGPRTKCCLAPARRPVQIPVASITTNPKLHCPPSSFPLPTRNTEKQNRP